MKSNPEQVLETNPSGEEKKKLEEYVSFVLVEIDDKKKRHIQVEQKTNSRHQEKNLQRYLLKLEDSKETISFSLIPKTRMALDI